MTFKYLSSYCVVSLTEGCGIKLHYNCPKPKSGKALNKSPNHGTRAVKIKQEALNPICKTDQEKKCEAEAAKLCGKSI